MLFDGNRRATHSYKLLITADKDIISSDESSTITALLKKDGVAYGSQTLSYTIKHGSTTISSGSKTTNSNGQATIPYIGTGVGDVQVIVSYGTLLQETFVLEDYLKYDVGTIANHNDAIWNAVTYLTRNIEDTTFTNTAVSTINTGISNNIIIEFDLKYNTGSTSPVIQIREGSSNILLSATRQQLGLSNNEYTHIKISINDNQAVISNSTNTNTVVGDVTGFNRFYFRIGANETIQFKNFVTLVDDCTFIDYAVAGNKNTKWVNQLNSGSPSYTVTVDSTGTLLVKNVNGNYTPSTVANSTNWNDRLLINEPYAVEFDLVEVNATGGAFRMYYNNSLQQQSDITVTGTGHYKFVMEQDKVYYIKDNDNPVTIADNLNITVFENPAFVNCASIKFKNFILYKI